ncbi:hypothetical protein [Psychromonas ossibalaenae]|uniref:hypothetical protein n=1 Tax=Psychromonas ossibalaenae TaxID=444922 RepID=UPI00035F8373|nr:hypothetical protein [Psychromonas ossibalaenae]
MKKFAVLLSLILFILSPVAYAGGCAELKVMGDTYNNLNKMLSLQVKIYNNNVLRVKNDIQNLFTRVNTNDDVKAARKLNSILENFIKELRTELEGVEETYMDLDILAFERDNIEGKCRPKAVTLSDDYIDPVAEEAAVLMVNYDDLIKELERINTRSKSLAAK